MLGRFFVQPSMTPSALNSCSNFGDEARAALRDEEAFHHMGAARAVFLRIFIRSEASTIALLNRNVRSG